jgi:hypothetical protein
MAASDGRGGPNNRIWIQELTHNQVILASDVTRNIFRAHIPMEVIGVFSRHSVAGGSGAAVMIKKVTGTTAPGSGTDILTAAFALTGTANTEQVGTLVATLATLRLAVGDYLAASFAGTLTNLVGMVSIVYREID